MLHWRRVSRLKLRAGRHSSDRFDVLAPDVAGKPVVACLRTADAALKLRKMREQSTRNPAAGLGQAEARKTSLPTTRRPGTSTALRFRDAEVRIPPPQPASPSPTRHICRSLKIARYRVVSYDHVARRSGWAMPAGDDPKARKTRWLALNAAVHKLCLIYCAAQHI